MSKLLIIDDVQGTCAAIPRGLALAESMDLAVDVIGFVWADLAKLRLDRKTTGAIKKQILAERKLQLEERVEEYRLSSRKIKMQAVWSQDIHEWIIRRAERDYQAVVKTRHRSSSLGRISTDWQLLRGCAAPVLLVGRKKWKRSGGVLATVDLDTSNRTKQVLNLRVVREARHYAALFDVPLRVLAVIEVPTLLADLDIIDPKSWAEARRAELRPALEKLADATGLPSSHFEIRRGPVDKTIVSEAAEMRAQLVVMGTVARKGVKGQVLGNTSEQVLELLKTDTLTIKP